MYKYYYFLIKCFSNNNCLTSSSSGFMIAPRIAYDKFNKAEIIELLIKLYNPPEEVIKTLYNIDF